MSFRSCFRIFSVASVQTFFYTVISPPPRPKFRFLLGFPLLMPPLPAVSFPNRLPPRNFFEILRFPRGFFPAAPQFLPRLISCLARHFYRRLLCHSSTVFSLPRRIYLGFISKPPLPLNFPVVLRFFAARGCRFSAFFPS